MNELAYVNGTFCPIAEATVSIEDRGFQFGDGIYEVIVAYGGRLFLLEPHMRRLRRSAAAIELDYDFDAAPLEPIIAEGLRRSGYDDALIYLQMTRGSGSRNHVIPDGLEVTVVMTFKPLPIPNEGLRKRGARVMTVVDTRWAKCYVKAITLLPNTLAKNRALRNGYDDAIFVTTDGEVRECTAANLSIVHDGRILIPPRTEAILHGITQGFIIECAAALGHDVTEQAFNIQTLHEAEEVFLSGATVGVLGITAIDDRPVGDGNVGPITRRLSDEYDRRARCTASDLETAGK